MAGQDGKAVPTTRLSGQPSSLVASVRRILQCGARPGRRQFEANARGLSVGSSTIITLMPTQSESMDRGTCSSIGQDSGRVLSTTD
jgi:hypothetical protein